MIGELNRYLHPHVGYVEISKSHSPNCPALVAWDDEEYEKCITILQDVVSDLLWLLLHHIRKFHSRRLQYRRTQSTLRDVEEVFDALEKLEAVSGQKLIFSKRLRSFIGEYRSLALA